MKRAAFFDPYLDTGGGGERYFMTAAQSLKKAGWNVEVQWKNPEILGWLGERLGMDFSGIGIVSDIAKGAGYDFCFWLSDGSVPVLFAKNNLLHFQTPFRDVGGKNLFNKLKMLKINNIVCNSLFTKKVIDFEYGVKSKVLYPPVSVEEFKSAKKENIILSLGRFSQLQQAKKQDVLVDAFKDMCKKGLKNWQLVVAGASEIGGKDFAARLKTESKGHPIEIIENLPFSEVKKYYAKAKIFWSASGFEINEITHPEKVEHFGITVVEAMSAEVVPVVFDNGGHKEIIKEGETGFLWKTLDDLQETTLSLIRNERRRNSIAKKAKTSSEQFSQRNFEKKFLEFVQ